MSDLDNFRDRLLGQRFYSTEAEESFTVVGVDEPGLALLQYDDGTPWDEMCSGFLLDEDSAERLGLNEDGLDSEQFVPLGAGPRIQQACDVGDHDWFPSPDQVWPDGLPDSIREVEPGHPRDLYNQFVRCKQCGFSASTVGSYAAEGHHQAPWFCHDCGEVHPGNDLVYRREKPHCQECASQCDVAEE